MSNATQTETTTPRDYMAEERAKRWAKLEAHQREIEAHHARLREIRGEAPAATWTLTPIPYDPWAE